MNTEDKRSQTSAENGKKGGRPMKDSTIRAQLARDYISEQVQHSIEPIVAKAINDAILGNDVARAWLADRAWGRPMQAIEMTGAEGTELFKNVPPALIALAKEYDAKLKDTV
jgi:hypothetical protein